MTAEAAAQIQMLVDALVATGWRLWETSHNNTPSAQLLFEWMRNIALGHFVLEVSSIRNSPAMDRVGVLLSIKSGDEYTIRTVDERELRWENSSFVRIPRSEAENREIFRLGQRPMTAQGKSSLKRLDPTWWRKVSDGYDQQDGRARLVRLTNTGGTKVTRWTLYIDGECVGSWSSLREAKERAANRTETWAEAQRRLEDTPA